MKSAKPTPTTSQEWYDYYTANAKSQLPIPWELGPEITPSEIEKIARSLQAWQLGETSDGSHLLAAAQKYAQSLNDPQFIEVVRLFIAEEQRHGGNLGRFLDLAGIPRINSNWGDSSFRLIRYFGREMEIWATSVVMVETMALIYYKAIRQATRSTVLRQICKQILQDEVSHIRFQVERLAILHRNRPKWLRLLTYGIQRVLFWGITLAVWADHHQALRAGGFNFRGFWRTAWTKMNFAWKMMNPEIYRWGDEPKKIESVEMNLQKAIIERVQL
ncbi:MAG: ferritin-like domain-containing protein [Chloroflexi bacterium]|nr:ferritin-like domain-containing protein [Chloroflexota bacterium]